MKTLTIRNIPKDVEKGINAYKKELGIKNTTSAIFGIVTDHIPLTKHVEKLEAKVDKYIMAYTELYNQTEEWVEDMNNVEDTKKAVIHLLENRVL